MVCVYCSGSTQVVNSRHQKRNNNIWRRRCCTSCGSIITTHEKPDLSTSFVVRAKNTEAQPFIRDKLFLSIHASCQHRPAALQEASALTQTIITKLNFQHNASIDSKVIVVAALAVLNRFDPVAATVYRAYHSAT